MASDYDHQLIESVTVRRHRLLTALLYGGNLHERRWLDSSRLFFLSVAAAAVMAAACVGFAFVSNLLAENHAQQNQQSLASLPASLPAAASRPSAGCALPLDRTGACAL